MSWCLLSSCTCMHGLLESKMPTLSLKHKIQLQWDIFTLCFLLCMISARLWIHHPTIYISDNVFFGKLETSKKVQKTSLWGAALFVLSGWQRLSKSMSSFIYLQHLNGLCSVLKMCTAAHTIYAKEWRQMLGQLITVRPPLFLCVCALFWQLATSAGLQAVEI